ncbi:hypothetical protein SHIRM173S_01389 [Streptomyces hirsutus]
MCRKSRRRSAIRAWTRATFRRAFSRFAEPFALRDSSRCARASRARSRRSWRGLRHREYRVYKESGSGDLFRADATFCPVRGANGAVRLSAHNFPEQYLRHYDAQLWLATPGGTHAWDSPALFAEDTTWTVAAPWAP